MNIKYNISRLMFKKYQHYSYQPVGLINTPTFKWIQEQSNLPWLKLNVEIPADIILHEIKNIKHLLVPHRDDYNEHQGWFK